MTGFTWRADAIMRALDASPTGTTEVGLEAGDWAWDPATSRGLIAGPATVEYRLFMDGGVTATVTRP